MEDKSMYQRLIDTLQGSKDEALEEIRDLQQHILDMDEALEEVKARKVVSECPLCGGDLLKLVDFDFENKKIIHPYGFIPLKTSLESTSAACICYGHGECQNCGVQETVEGAVNIQGRWSRDNMPNGKGALAAIILNSLPAVDEVIMGRDGYGTEFLFVISGQCYTFGKIKREEVISRLMLKAPQAQRSRRQDGFVYLIGADLPMTSVEYYKIGYATNIENRTAIFGVKLPFEFDLIHHFPADDMAAAEAELHRFYSEKRAEGEWFTLSSDDICSVSAIEKYENGQFYPNPMRPTS